MAQHIVLMNVLAPLVVAGAMMTRAEQVPSASPRWIVAATIIQLVLLWFWHLPATGHGFHLPDARHLAMLVSLFAGALLFWWAVLSARDDRWRALVALLITGKLFCLLGALLTFAPRVVYLPHHCGTGSCAAGDLLADQQLAGLMMLIACPVTYTLAAVLLAARWLGALDQQRHAG